jgi:hypothetical protein
MPKGYTGSTPMTPPDTEQPLFLPETNDRVFCCRVLEKMQTGRYERAGAAMRDMVKARGEIRMVIDYQNFDGWEDDETKIDMGLSVELGPYLTKIAPVNPPPIIIAQMKMKSLVMPRITIRYFENGEYDLAVKWANED